MSKCEMEDFGLCPCIMKEVKQSDPSIRWLVFNLSSLDLLLLLFQEDGNCVIPSKYNKASTSETKRLIEPLGNALSNAAHLLLRQNTAAETLLGKMSGRGILQNTWDCGAQYDCLRELNTGRHWEKHYKLLDVMALLSSSKSKA